MLVIATCLLSIFSGLIHVDSLPKFDSISVNENFAKTPDKFLQAYNGNRFDSICRLFQYPKNQDLKAHTEDSTILYCIFYAMKEKWGAISEFNKIKLNNNTFVDISMNTADTSYWNSRKKFCTDSTYYKIKYSSGRELVFGFIQCKLDKMAKIWFFKLIIPYPEAATKEQIAELERRLNLMIQKFVELGMEKNSESN